MTPVKARRKNRQLSRRTLISLNGRIVSPEQATISVLDSGLLAGLGAFETILAQDKFVFRLAAHLARFEKSRRALGLRRRFSQSEVKQFLRQALERFSEKRPQESDADNETYRRVRITLTGGATGNGLWGAEGLDGSLIIIVQEHALPKESARLSAEIVSSATPLHWLAGHKTLSRMLYSHATPFAGRRRGKALRILYHPSVGVTEFESASLFVRRGARVVTAPDEHVFPGICRASIIKHWGTLAPEFKLEIRQLKISDLLNADEVIGVNSLRAAFALSRLTDNAAEASKTTVIYEKPSLSVRLRRFLLDR